MGGGVGVDIEGLIALGLNKWTLLTAGGVYLLLRVTNQLAFISGRNWYRRILPVAPELLGIAATFAGGNPAVAKAPIVVKIAAGLWCGYLAQRFHKVLGQTILGDDKKITTTKAAEAPRVVSAPTPSLPPEEKR